MQLFYRELGENKPVIIILHGLYGASDNWFSIAKTLSLNFKIFVIDLRNHGRSSHHHLHDYTSLSDDVLEFMIHKKIDNATILGHSMGGKTAMHIAFKASERINKLIIVDIAPKNYSKLYKDKHCRIIQYMLSLNLDSFTHRKAIEDKLINDGLDSRESMLILKNIYRKNKKLLWRTNLGAIKSNIDNILAGFDDAFPTSDTPTLFIKAQNSDYIQKQDYKTIRQLFIHSRIREIKDSGHWVHLDQTDKLLSEISHFLNF